MSGFVRFCIFKTEVFWSRTAQNCVG